MSVAHIVGDSNAEGPPVPIPNTEVKLCSGENTCLETDRKDSSMPTYVAFHLAGFRNMCGDISIVNAKRPTLWYGKGVMVYTVTPLKFYPSCGYITMFQIATEQRGI